MAYQGNSIVDYLKSTGGDSSFGARTTLAGKYGIKNYSGTADQNMALLSTLNPSATNPARDTFVSNQTQNTGASNSNAETGNSTDQSTTTTPATDPFSTYRGYLSEYSKSLVEDPAVAKARTDLATIQSDIDTRDLEARREYESKLDESGGLRGGAQMSAAVSRRRSNSELADLAVRQGGAARTLDALSTGSTAKQNYLKTRAELSQPMKLGDSYYDPTTGKLIPNTNKPDAFELSPGQTRYAYDPATGEYKEVASKPSLPKEPAKLTEAEKAKPMKDDVTAAVTQLQQIVKAKGFRGVSPDDYETMVAYLMSEYGYEATLELNKALEAVGLFVDRSNK